MFLSDTSIKRPVLASVFGLLLIGIGLVTLVSSVAHQH